MTALVLGGSLRFLRTGWPHRFIVRSFVPDAGSQAGVIIAVCWVTQVKHSLCTRLECRNKLLIAVQVCVNHDVRELSERNGFLVVGHRPSVLRFTGDSLLMLPSGPVAPVHSVPEAAKAFPSEDEGSGPAWFIDALKGQFRSIENGRLIHPDR